MKINSKIDIILIEKELDTFTKNLKTKWQKAKRLTNIFLKYNADWLSTEIFTASYSALTLSMPFISGIKNLGRPKVPFQKGSTQTKRRVSKNEILF